VNPNGAKLNGVKPKAPNGTKLNGVNAKGTKLNGTKPKAPNGTKLNGVKLNVVTDPESVEYEPLPFEFSALTW
tara:strand:- start:382 stop:600 length:219 start_codon:yes stop_codon:yes gene_type:complete